MLHVDIYAKLNFDIYTMNTKTILYTLLIAGIALHLSAGAPDQALERSLERQQQIATSIEKATDSASMASALNSLEKSWRDTTANESTPTATKESFCRAFVTNYQAALLYSQRFNSSPAVSIALERLDVLMRNIQTTANSSKARRNAMSIASVLMAAEAAGYPPGSWKTVKDAVAKLRNGFMVGNNGPFRIDNLSDSDAEAAMTLLSLKSDGSIVYIGPRTVSE